MRHQARTTILEIDTHKRLVKSKNLIQELSALLTKLFKPGSIIGGFAPLDLEPQLENLYADQTFAWAFPRVLKNDSLEFAMAPYSDLQPNKKYGISLREPDLAFEAVSCTGVLVPGLAFDREGQRLGKGKGCYDRYLSEHSETVSIGIAFHEQVMEKLTIEDHDRPMDWVVTDQTTFRRTA